jgi:hypothetical protein
MLIPIIYKIKCVYWRNYVIRKFNSYFGNVLDGLFNCLWPNVIAGNLPFKNVNEIKTISEATSVISDVCGTYECNKIQQIHAQQKKAAPAPSRQHRLSRAKEEEIGRKIFLKKVHRQLP